MLHSQHARTSLVAEPTQKKYTQEMTEKGEPPCGAAPEVPTSFAYTYVFPKKTVIIQHDEEI